MKTFKEYLIQKGHAEKSATRAQNTANDFNEWCKTTGTELKNVDYNAMISYVSDQKAKGNRTRTIQQKLTTLRHYYEYLGIGINPALLVKLRSDTITTPNHLLSSEQLEQLYKSYPSHGLIKKRDKIIVSLAIYQGISSGEFALIERSDVDLMNGTIYIPSSRSTSSRTLELKPFQLLLIQEYLLKVRPKILHEAGKASEKLLVSTGQSGKQLHNVISKIIKVLREEYPQLKDFKQIRQSVITSWVKQHGVRKAQYMAGHRFVSSTERYNQSANESLKNALKTLHPLQ